MVVVNSALDAFAVGRGDPDVDDTTVAVGGCPGETTAVCVV